MLSTLDRFGEVDMKLHMGRPAKASTAAALLWAILLPGPGRGALAEDASGGAEERKPTFEAHAAGGLVASIGPAFGAFTLYGKRERVLTRDPATFKVVASEVGGDATLFSAGGAARIGYFPVDRLEVAFAANGGELPKRDDYKATTVNTLASVRGYWELSDRLALYGGLQAGPSLTFFEFLEVVSISVDEAGRVVSTVRKRKDTEIEFAGGGLVGAEIFVSRDLSLSLEYNALALTPFHRIDAIFHQQGILSANFYF